MELRHFTLIAFWFLSVAAHAAVRAYPLDERTVYSIRIGRDAPTTCVFPDAPTALEGAGVSTKTDDGAAVLLSHQPGTGFFSVRALRDDAAGALNVVFRGKVFVLSFATGGEPDRVVRFLDVPLAGVVSPAKPQPTEQLRMLVARARQWTRLAAQFPSLASTVEHAEPGTVTRYPTFSVTLAEVFRFEAEDTLVFRLRLLNEGDTPVFYDSAQLAVRAGTEIYPASWVDASGAIPPHGGAEVYLAVAGAPGGGRANLSVRERFTVIVPLP